MYAEAIAELSKGKTISKNLPLIVGELGYAYAASAQRTEARKQLQELSGQATRRYVAPFLFAMAYIGLGEKDQTFAWLEKAYEDRSSLVSVAKLANHCSNSV